MQAPIGKLAGMLNKTSNNNSNIHFTPTNTQVNNNSNTSYNTNDILNTPVNNNSKSAGGDQHVVMIPPLPSISSIHESSSSAANTTPININASNIQSDTATPAIPSPNNKSSSNHKSTPGISLPTRLSDSDGRPPRVDTLIYKQRINVILGPVRGKTYWKLIDRYFCALISKREFDQNIIQLFNDTNNSLYLHNELFLAILQNACSAELPDLTQHPPPSTNSKPIKSPSTNNTNNTMKTNRTNKSKTNNKQTIHQHDTSQLSDDDNISITSQQHTNSASNKSDHSAAAGNKKHDRNTGSDHKLKSSVSPRKRQKSVVVDDTDTNNKMDMAHQTLQYITTYKQYFHALHNTNCELNHACIYGPIALTYTNAYIATYGSLSSTYQLYNQRKQHQLTDMTADDEVNYDDELTQYINHHQSSCIPTPSNQLPTHDYVRSQLNIAARYNGIKRLSDSAITLLTKASHAYIHLLLYTLLATNMDSNDNNNELQYGTNTTAINSNNSTTLAKPTVLSGQISNNIPSSILYNNPTSTNDMPNLEVVSSDGSSTVTPAKSTQHHNINNPLSMNNHSRLIKRKLSIDGDDLLMNESYLNYIHDFESIECLDRIIATR